MSAIDDIKAWLEEPTYWEGVQLYCTHGTNAYLKEQFQESSESWLRALLTSELTELLQAFEAAEKAKVNARPAEITTLLKEAQSLMDERSALKERARLYIEQGHDASQELQRIAKRIIGEIKPRLDEIFGLRDFYDANGYLPQSAEVAIQTVASLVKRRNTLRTYLSRTKGNSSKLELWRAELFEIENKIKSLE